MGTTNQRNTRLACLAIIVMVVVLTTVVLIPVAIAYRVGGPILLAIVIIFLLLAGVWFVLQFLDNLM
jgi:hypothetical protein